ncbi:hypothetical protein AB2762_04340 [Acinetobacter indicus]
MRADMCAKIEEIMGPGRVEVHHHEVASCQFEIGASFKRRGACKLTKCNSSNMRCGT